MQFTCNDTWDYSGSVRKISQVKGLGLNIQYKKIDIMMYYGWSVDTQGPFY